MYSLIAYSLSFSPSNHHQRQLKLSLDLLQSQLCKSRRQRHNSVLLSSSTPENELFIFISSQKTENANLIPCAYPHSVSRKPDTSSSFIKKSFFSPWQTWKTEPRREAFVCCCSVCLCFAFSLSSEAFLSLCRRRLITCGTKTHRWNRI